MTNTYKNGNATIFLYQKEKTFIGVCLELDIVDEDTDADVLKKRMKERVESYIAYIVTNNKGEELLNRNAPDEYWYEFSKYLQAVQTNIAFRKSSPSLMRASVESIPMQDFAKA